MRYIILLVLALGVFRTEAQITYSCVDSSRIPNTYQPCGTDYRPVCGCDDVTYRNECAAFYWGGLNSWSLDEAVCGNFHFDFYPTAVYRFTPYFRLFVNNPSALNVSLQLFIYDAYGKLKYEWFDVISHHGKYPQHAALEMPEVLLFEEGIYNLIVIVNGEKQFLKFAKIGEVN